MVDPAELALETTTALVAAGLVFTWALCLGVVKYVQITRSPEAHAHVYIDIAHRAALMYSFALLLIAVFAELSDWATAVDVTAVLVQVFFFVGAIGSYMWHGLRRDTDNQLRHASSGVTAFMIALIVGEIGGFVVLFAGYLHALA